MEGDDAILEAGDQVLGCPWQAGLGNGEQVSRGDDRDPDSLERGDRIRHGQGSGRNDVQRRGFPVRARFALLRPLVRMGRDLDLGAGRPWPLSQPGIQPRDVLRFDSQAFCQIRQGDALIGNSQGSFPGSLVRFADEGDRAALPHAAFTVDGAEDEDMGAEWHRHIKIPMKRGGAGKRTGVRRLLKILFAIDP